jgi:hypothetical protein
MATAKEQLMKMMSPRQGMLLDQQLRDQQVAQRAQGAGMLSGLVQAYTGMGDIAQRATGIMPMGAMEQQAIQQQEQQKVQAGAIGGATGANRVEQLRNVANRLRDTGSQKNMMLAEQYDSKADEIELKLMELGVKQNKPSAKIMVNKDNGISYRVVNDGKGNVKVFKAGTNQEVDVTDIDLVEPTVFNTMEVARRKNQEQSVAQQVKQLESIVDGLSETSQRLYNRDSSKLSPDMDNKEANAMRIGIALKYAGEDAVKSANLSQDEYISTMSFIDQKVNNISSKRSGITSIGYKAGQLIPGTDAYDIAADISTLQSNAFMSQLMAMKEASKNGASGMGQVTEKEVQLLIDSLGNIDPAQSKDQFERNLKIFRDRFNAIQKKIALSKGATPEPDPDQPSAENRSDIDAEYEAVLAEYNKFKEGNSSE